MSVVNMSSVDHAVQQEHKVNSIIMLPYKEAMVYSWDSSRLINSINWNHTHFIYRTGIYVSMVSMSTVL